MRAWACVLAVASGTCFAAFSPPASLKVVTDDNYPPYLFRAENGELRGIIKDKWDLWSARTGVPVRLEGTTWTRAQEMARKGEADVIETIAFTEARRSLYEFSPPYADVDARVFFHTSVGGINDVASMRGFTIGAKEGSACGKWLADRGPVEIRSYPASEALVVAAIAGDVRLFCMDSPAARYFLVKLGKAEEFRETQPLYSTSLHWAVAAGKADLRNFIQAGFGKIYPDDLKAIEQRWHGSAVSTPFDRNVLATLILGVVLALAGAALLLLWNRSLRASVAARTSDLRDALEAIARQAESSRKLYDNAPCGYHSLDLQGNYVEVNDTESRWLGVPREELIGKPFGEFLTPESRERLRSTFPRFLQTGEARDIEFELARRDGTTMRILLSATMQRDARGRPFMSNATLYDITARTIAEERVAHMAHHDALTGLPNRTLLLDRLQQAIAQAHRSHRIVGVMSIDLDRFKALNDSLGHAAGDCLLQAVGLRLAQNVREGDTLARVGGDGFVAVLPELEGASDASEVAMQILSAVARSFELDATEIHVAASLGIALYPGDGEDAELLLRHAETAMLHAKAAGRANYQFFAEHMNVAAHERLAVEQALRRGLDLGEFELEYQPIFDTRTRTVVEFEALLRWHPAGRLEAIVPADFIAVAEDSRLIVPIGDWVLGEALAQAWRWQQKRPDLKIAVNVSANQLARPDFYDRLCAVVHKSGLDPRSIEMEVTETVMIESEGTARETINKVASLGVGIVVDDFGTGYAGLAYLKRLPVTKIKIDQSFVRNLLADRGDAAIVAAVLAMARGLGVEVVAEGVETEEQLAELRRLGCERVQGFLLSRPLSADRVDVLLSSPVAAVAD